MGKPPTARPAVGRNAGGSAAHEGGQVTGNGEGALPVDDGLYLLADTAGKVSLYDESALRVEGRSLCHRPI